jgi:hypothetical protein
MLVNVLTNTVTISSPINDFDLSWYDLNHIRWGAKSVLREIAGERRSSDALKTAELEPLSGTRWRLMVMPSALNQCE